MTERQSNGEMAQEAERVETPPEKKWSGGSATQPTAASACSSTRRPPRVIPASPAPCIW